MEIRNEIKNAVNQAKRLVSDKDKIKKLIHDSKLKEKLKVPRQLLMDIVTIRDMVSEWLKGEYQMPVKTVLYLLAGLIYFVNPLDLVPDFIVGLGLLDDAAVIAFIVKKLRSEIERFRIDYYQSPQEATE